MTQLPARVQRELAFSVANEKAANLRAYDAEARLDAILEDLREARVQAEGNNMTGGFVRWLIESIHNKYNTDPSKDLKSSR